MDAAATVAIAGDASYGSAAREKARRCLSAFVEVRFRGQVRRTAAVDADAPTWNEQVRGGGAGPGPGEGPGGY